MSVAENRKVSAASATIAQALRQAVVHHQAGQLQEAEQLYRVILQVQPGHPDANHNLGVLLGQAEQHATALPHLKAALEADPSQGDYWLSYADALLACGQAGDALTVIQTAIQHGLDTPAAQLIRDKADAAARDVHATNVSEVSDKTFQSQTPQARTGEISLAELPGAGKTAAGKPAKKGKSSATSSFSMKSAPQAECDQLAALLNAGRHAEVERQARLLIKRYPDFGFAWKMLSIALHFQGKNSLSTFEKVTELLPDDAEGHCNLGNALRVLGRLGDAVASCRRALAIKPDFAEAYYNLGNAQRDLGQLDDAAASFRRALEIKPDYAEAHNNLGNILKDLGQFDVALASYHRALEIKPDYADVFYNLGNALQDRGQLNDAVTSYRRALEIKPDYVGAYNNLGFVLQNLGQFDGAVASYRRALEIKPDYVDAHSNLLFVLNYHPDKNSEEIFAVYREYDERFGLPLRGKWRAHGNSRDSNRRLKVGYVSPDFRYHSCRHFLEPLLAHHDKNVVEVYAYAELAREDEVTARYKGYVDHWTQTAGMADDALSERIRADGIDILVDLAGHTAKNRLSVFARKPAPVSLSWLGFGYTTGLTAVDYLLTDAASAPEGSEGLFSETPWRLTTPGYVYRPAEGMGAVNLLPALTRGYVTFGTLTRAIRINTLAVRVWSEILKRVEGSRLVIDSRDFRDVTMQAALVEQFAVHGVARERLEIGYHSPPWDVLRGLDIGLDCFPHNSGTTLFETLYMGIPFVTLAGRPSVGRLGSSILEGIGHPSLIAHTEDGYVEIAVALATDLARLARLRAGLRQEMESGPLMDEAGFARKVEAAYREMFEKWTSAMSVVENPGASAASATIAQAFQQAVVHHQAGQLREAEQLYRVILQVQPVHPDANHNLGVLLGQAGQHATALLHLKAALEADPSQGDYWLSYADALLACGQAEDALTVIQTAMQHGLDTPAVQSLRDKADADVRSRATDTLGISDPIGQPQAQPPSSSESLSQAERTQLITLFNAGRHAEMESRARLVCERDQDSGFAWKALGVALQMQGKNALAALRKATELLPDDADAHNSLGVVLKDHGQLDDAVASCRRALKIKPDLAEAHSNLGNALRGLGQFADAVASYRRALEIKPDYVEAHNNLGVTLKEIGRLDDAVASCRRALEIKPDYAEAHNSLGSVLKDLGQLDDAMASYLRALKIKPDFAEAHNNLGNLLKDFGRLDDAVASYRRALTIKPDYAEAHNNLLFTLNYHPDKSGEEIYAAYREYDERFGLPQRGKWRAHGNNCDTIRRLKVGYVSPDFRRHSCRHFLEPLLAHHDKNAVEVYAYAELVREDEVTVRYRGYVDHWAPTAGMTDDALSDRIRADGIDILVDLAGHTKGNRLAVFARKPAPVSLSWLGFGYTTGLTALNYLLTDAVAAPEGSERLFSETPWRMETPAYAYRPAEGMGAISPLPALTRGYVTFGTLTRAVRINHHTIRVWSELLQRVKGARLVIDSRDFRDTTMQAALAEKFAAHGVARDRLEIGCHSPPWDVLRGLDIGLDCFPHNSGTTLFETLYMGVPFVTLAGRPSVGRLGSSILEGIGHPSLIAHTEDEYIELAIALATDLSKLATLRGGLREEMETGPLMDEAGFARKVETAYREMWAKWSREAQRNGNSEELPDRTPQPQTKSHGISLAELLRAGKTVASKPAKKGKSSAKPASARESLPQNECNQLVALFNAGRYAEMENRACVLIEQYPDSGFAWKGLGASLQMQGKNALAALQKAAERLPNDADAHNNLGNALRNLGRIDEAAKRYAHALKIKPDFAEAHNNLGNALRDLGRFEAAAASCRRALQIKPDFAEAHSNLGNALLALGQREGALASYAQALALKLDYAEAHNNLGVALQALGRFEDAVASHCRALEIKPDYVEAHNNLGNALKDLERLDDAVASFRRALEVKPDYAEAHNNLGNALRELGQLDGALASYTRALAIDPGFAEAHNNLGNVLKDFELLDDAVASYVQALEIKPDYFEAYNNLGNAQKDLGQLDDAVASYAQALKIKPDFAEAHSNLGSALKDLGRFRDAVASFRRALEIKPDYAEAHNNLLFTLNYHPDKSGEAIFAAYREYDERFGLPLREKWQPHGNSRDIHRRLKIGYVSPDFRRHSCRHFLEPLLSHHDKNIVEVYAYAELLREDEVTARYRGYVDHWVSTVGMSDDALSERIRADGIDILVDLAGHTAKNRLSVFARKPAPVSLSWLGFGYTTGLTAVDYLLTDSASAPEGSEGLFSETPWRLETPGYAYRPAEGMGAVSPLPALTRGYITFGTLTRAVRINQHTIRVWSEILKRVDDSRLVIDSRNFVSAAMQDALLGKFVAHGVARERLEIGYHSPPWDVLRSLDIGLDCFPHNSGTTLFETLYLGIPFVTLAGRPSVGRLGSSILEGVGHPEWIARTEDGYVEIAAALASDLPKLAALRGGLRGEMETSSLMDEAGFARKVEAAYREMFGRWARG